MAPWIKANVNEKDLPFLERLGIEYFPLESFQTKQISELDNKNWIVIPGKGEEPKGFSNPVGHRYAVSPGRIEYGPAVERAGKELGLKLKNTSKDSLGRKFVGNINWEQAMKLDLLLGKKATNPLEHFTFLDLINKGAEGKVPVYDVKGNKLDPKYLGQIREDIIKVQSPWRAEWHDADFRFIDNRYYIWFNHKMDENGELEPRNKQLLAKNTLMENKIPGINLDSVLGNTTKQGLPKKSAEEGKFYYWGSDNDNNSVAWFVANVDRAGFNCLRDRSGANSDLGVRASEKLE
jgi:hypothetical protein